MPRFRLRELRDISLWSVLQVRSNVAFLVPLLTPQMMLACNWRRSET